MWSKRHPLSVYVHTWGQDLFVWLCTVLRKSIGQAMKLCYWCLISRVWLIAIAITFRNYFSGSLLLQAAATLEGDHGLIASSMVFSQWRSYSVRNLSCSIFKIICTLFNQDSHWVEILIVAEVDKAMDLSESLSRNPVSNGVIMQEWILPPVVAQSRELDYAREYHESKVSP